MLAKVLKIVFGLYLGIAGAFMALLLAVDFIDPEWVREAKATNPLGPEQIPTWFYITATILTAACLYSAWALIRSAFAKPAKGAEDKPSL